MSRRNKLWFSMMALGVLLLATVACGGSKEPAQGTGGAETQKAIPEAIDTSTGADWQVNCAQFRKYRGELIFTAAETTTPDGKRVVAWAANDRAAFLAVFRELALDGVPELKQRRDRILVEAEKAPGGGRIAILPELNGMIDSLWSDIEVAAKRHGVSCREPKV